MTTAVVVGSGPNGLAGALTLAANGLDVRVLEAAATVGGGARTSESTLPGLLHDSCSAFHPMALASPFFRRLDLESDGLRWRWPRAQVAHPLDGGRVALLWQDLDRTADGLGLDGQAWRSLLDEPAARFDDLVEDLLRPVLHRPRHLGLLTRFGSRALLPASVLAHRWRGDEARALFAGVAAHAFSRLDRPLSSAPGLMLAAAAHAHGWPVAEGGSQSITDALIARLEKVGVRIETGVRVTSRDQLDDPDVLLLDVTASAALELLGEPLPGRTQRAYRRFRHGPAAHKVDYAIEGDIPWANTDVLNAGTVHLGGSFEEIAAAEHQVVRGQMPERPFVLLGQQYLVDPSRSGGEAGLNPIYAYAHVPHGWTGDATEAVTAQIERFAPGFRDRLRAVHTRDPAGLEAHDANWVGGDIGGGASAGLQILFRPRVALDPYATGIPGTALCSSATPPGGGVHGMCGFWAARSALRTITRGHG